VKRVGFACMWIDSPEQIGGIGPHDEAKKLNTRTTTIAWLNRQDRSTAEDRLIELVQHNMLSARLLIERVGSLRPELRMVRLSSDLIPAYTHEHWAPFWRSPEVVRLLERGFAQVGEAATTHGVRISFHPGQFCVLGSDVEHTVERSIEEFEYHADMARWMGRGQQFQDMKINVHISGRRGPAGVREVYTRRLSTEARNCITLENEEMSHGLDATLSVADIIPTVLDLHHHWVREGEYISATDDRVKRVIESWRGRRPAFHYSLTRESVLPAHSEHEAPAHALLLEAGQNKQKLRAHSDFMWNRAVNRWAASHWEWGDVMVECKSKNLGAHALFNEWMTGY
jgi:UV DNA damage endonuclease